MKWPGGYKIILFSCRCHVVGEFNRGIYDYIIATDEVGAPRGGGVAGGETVGGAKSASRKRKRDKEYGVTRGIDFQGKLYCD